MMKLLAMPQSIFPITFSAATLTPLCDKVAALDSDLQRVLDTYGYPPFCDRPNSFETLVHIILEQQVSLASARAALEKLRERLNVITPQAILTLTDSELKACYVSRQKAGYIRGLSNVVLSGQLNFDTLTTLSDDDIRNTLLLLKGIGHWTVDVYLILVLHRPNHFPFGDIAAINGLKEVKNLPKTTPREALEPIVAAWAPYCSIATMLVWHSYLSRRGRTY